MNTKTLHAFLLSAGLSLAGQAATMYYGTGSSAVWNTSTANWGTVTGGPYTSVYGSTSHDAVFEGTGKAVTVSTVSANSISLLSNGYTLSSGTITLGSPAGGPAISVGIGLTASISSVLNRAGGGAALRKTGSGTLTYTGLSVINGYHITVEGGTLAVGTGGRLWHDTTLQGSSVLTVASGATLDLQTWGYGTGTSLGALRGNANAIVLSGGTIRMSGGTTSYSRGMTINSGGATLEAGTGVNWTLGSTTANVYSGNPSLTFTGAGNGDFQKIFSGTGGLTKSGAGTWQLTGANIYTGNTTVSGGTLKITGRIYDSPHNTTSVVTVQTGGVLELDTWLYGSGTQSLGMLSAGADRIVINNGTIRVNGTTSYGRGVTVLAGGATFEAATGANWTQGGLVGYIANVYIGNPSLTFTGAGNGTFDKAFSGSGSLKKSGAGTWTLTRDNSYSGATTIEEGTLRVNGTHTGGGLITVKSGATLGGSGTMVNVTAENGGILSPGSSAGSITMGDLTLNADSILNLELDNLSSPSDKVIVTNYFDDIGGKLNVSGLPGLGTPDVGTSWLVIDYTAAIGSRNNGVNLSLGTNTTGLNLGLDVSQVGKVLLVVVPEPASAGLVLMGLVFILRARKGRQLKGGQTGL